MKKIIEWPIANYRITLLVVLLLFGFGLYGLKVMPKDEFPAFVVRQGVVIAAYPGATSEEVEAQVARPLERYLFTFKEVNRSKSTTTSMNGMCVMMIQLHDNISNKDEVWSKIKHGLNSFKTSLPKGVLAVIVNDDFGEASALLIAIESEQRSYRELQNYSDDLADRLRQIPSVSNVRQYGNIKEQISLYIDRKRLAAYGLGQSSVMQALSSEDLITMSGSLTNAKQNIQLHLAPTQRSEEEIANQIIYSDSQGHTVRIRDIAEVKREYDTSESYIEQNGHRCVLLSLEMTPGNNIVQYGEDVDEVLKRFSDEYLPDDVHMERISDLPEVVGSSIYSFLRDLVISMIIIILVMMILFPLRSALVAAITIPLSTFISVGLMYALNIPLNIITLASLIVVLGMIVDNSIVVIDGYLEYLGKGETRINAAINSAKQYFMPMLLATVCICAIFYPILYTMKDGQAGDVIGYFPITITINLMVSLLVAVAVIPYLNTTIIRKVKVPKEGKRRITDYVQIYYERILSLTFKHPWRTIMGSIVLVIASCLLFPLLKLRLFPYADRNQFAVEIFLPEGEGLSHTEAIADSMRHVLERDERILGITSFIGCSSPRFQVSYAPQMGGRNFAQFIVNTPSNKTTLDVLNDYAPKYSNAFPGAYVKFKRLDFLDVPTYEYRFYGNDLDSISLAAERLMVELRKIPELEWVHTDFEQPHPIIDIALDPVASAQLGINRTSAALQLMMNTGDMKAGSIWEGNYEVPVVIKDEVKEKTYSDIQDIYLSATGYASLRIAPQSAIALRQVADVHPTWSQSNIVHRNGERCISVTAEGKMGTLATPIQSHIASILEDMPLPKGVRAEIGGEVEKNNEMVPQIAWGIGLAMVLIFFFLLFNFKNFSIPVVCMIAIGLCMPGAMIGLVLANRTLGLTSLFGFITLMGIIMRNEILIFEHANEKMAQGWSARDAAFDAGRRRMVPIFLTTATTAVGVIPMILAGSSFWMPVGITIFGGGIGTLILVVTVLPVVYWKIYEKKTAKS
ncbi:MAG: efflux RND transporter permease subunit [Bacteroidales bacterium]|nr:efflux RND transporter permease subunit [Bacteroidales bacterium]